MKAICVFNILCLQTSLLWLEASAISSSITVSAKCYRQKGSIRGGRIRRVEGGVCWGLSNTLVQSPELYLPLPQDIRTLATLLLRWRVKSAHLTPLWYSISILRRLFPRSLLSGTLAVTVISRYFLFIVTIRVMVIKGVSANGRPLTCEVARDGGHHGLELLLTL